MRLSLLLALLAACSPADNPGTLPVYLAERGAIFDQPWPTDARIDDDGTIDVSGMPRADEIPLLTTFLEVASGEGGYGTNSPIYVRFTNRINTSLLPDNAIQSVGDDSPILLLNIDPLSPRYGERIPTRWEYFESESTFLPGNLLAVAPIWGYPLDPTTQYALVVTTTLANPNVRFAEVWDPDHPDHALYADLGDALFFQHMAPSDVAIATVFTTGDPLDTMRRLAHHTQKSLQPPTLEQTLTHRASEDTLWYNFYEGRYLSPRYQHGEKPYATEGGQFVFDDDGVPVIHNWDEMRMAVCTPRDLSNPPEGGWPVVMYAHGTGGNYRSFCNDGSGISQASLFARAGFIGIGIDQPLSGDRSTPDTNETLHWFNYINPDSGRTNFLQAAIDSVYLARALAGQQVVLHTDDGPDIEINPDQLYFMGHSQGGISGAIAQPWLGQDVKATVLSGAGGGLAITIIERKDPLDIAAQIELLLQFGPNERLTELHPVAGLVQWLVEQTDPVNYAPYYFAVEGDWDTQQPRPVLIGSGEEDHATPNRAVSALAGAAQVSLIAPTFDETDVFAARELDVLRPPVSGNAIAYDGTEVTAGLSQWQGGSHWVFFEESDAALMYQNFLSTARDESNAVIDPNL